MEVEEKEKTVLRGFMEYIHKVYQIGEEIRQIRDERKRRSIKLCTAVYMLFIAFAFRVSSLNEIKLWAEEKNSRFKHLFKRGTRVPKIDALRDIVKMIHGEDIENILKHVVSKTIENKVLRENTIHGLRVAAVDGVEVFSSKVKSCRNCLSREVRGETEYFHKAVACMTVGSDPHIALGIEMLKPWQDGSEKDEGEMTGVKRLLMRLRREHHHFADVIVADALYMNAPFINLIRDIGMYSVIRAKNTRLTIVKDALGLFKNRSADKEFSIGKKEIKVWDEEHFHMDGTTENIRFLKFVESWIGPKGKKLHREMWCITTMPKEIPAETVWLIMKKRWDIENNGFRMLKTYFHADHCYIHGEGADEKILLMILLAFNLMELFMFRRLNDFRKKEKEGKMTRKHLTAVMWDELLLYDYSSYYESS